MSEQQAVGVLLSNLGTPSAPTATAVKAYLDEFLSDPKVVNIPKLIWWPILHGIVLRKRPPRVAENYQAIWTDEGSPLMAISVRQCKALQQQLDIPVELAMRYGEPSLQNGIDALRKKGVNRIIVLPLYPQYADSTTESTRLELSRWTKDLAIEFIENYHDDDGYIAAVATSIQRHWNERGGQNFLLFSFHGLPQAHIDKGDPYQTQCLVTAQKIVSRLGLAESEFKVSFQSRFGYAKWIGPATSETLQALAQAGTDSLSVVCPGFSADCLETLEEIKVENSTYFVQSGGKDYTYVSALNDHPDHITMMANLIKARIKV